MRLPGSMSARLRASAAAFCLCLLASAGAHADSFAWGVHGAEQSGGNFVSPGSFYDTYSFSISDALAIDSSVTVANNNPPLLSIAGGHYSLFGFGADDAMGTADDVNLGPLLGWSFDGSTGATPHLVSLASGNYYFAVEGIADGGFGGLYSITSTLVYTEMASPIPEPHSYLLLLAGLGLLGRHAARRRADAAQGDRPS
jgi:hypothetical protein